MNFVLKLIIFLCLCTISSCDPSTENLGPPEVDLCVATAKPDEFRGKLIRLRAYIHRDPENFAIYDLRCDTKDTSVWAQYDVSVDEKERSMLQDALCQTKPCPRGEARVLITGKLEGPSESGYGHLDDYRFEFTIIQVNEAYPISR